MVECHSNAVLMPSTYTMFTKPSGLVDLGNLINADLMLWIVGKPGSSDLMMPAHSVSRVSAVTKQLLLIKIQVDCVSAFLILLRQMYASYHGRSVKVVFGSEKVEFWDIYLEAIKFDFMEMLFFLETIFERFWKDLIISPEFKISKSLMKRLPSLLRRSGLHNDSTLYDLSSLLAVDWQSTRLIHDHYDILKQLQIRYPRAFDLLFPSFVLINAIGNQDGRQSVWEKMKSVVARVFE
ncbi:hypothetical protein BC829DRAFT_387028 [Chytridium lagenaria]|nr:hypothetical protein BC829DRAFT_387028 [Chytridium lagenaria]